MGRLVLAKRSWHALLAMYGNNLTVTLTYNLYGGLSYLISLLARLRNQCGSFLRKP